MGRRGITTARTLASVGALTAACLTAAAQTRGGDELLERLARLPQSTHNSTIRVEPDVRTGGTRVWIDANEDDTRLYTPAAGQMDIDVQLSGLIDAEGRPTTVSLLVETRGTARPGPGPQPLALVVDGRPLALTQRDGRPSTSGDLLFLSIEAQMPYPDFLALATASRVEGRVWGIPFRLLDAQLELLRAFAARVATGQQRDAP